LFIYPKQGQTQDQLNRDKYECHTWSVQQSGFNPMNSSAPRASGGVAQPPAEAAQGGVVRGGARGALLGVVGGAIAGDAGKGAAIGAATGALFGGMRRRDQRRRQDATQQQYQQQQMQAQQQQQQAAAQQRHGYNRAMTACLSARGYTVN
jgi:Sec-independent protein translocase protein TatA